MRVPYRIQRLGESIGESFTDALSSVHRLPMMKYGGGAPKVSVYPAVKDETELMDVYHKACFFLPQGSVEAVHIPIDFEPTFSIDAGQIPCPQYLEAVDARRADIKILPGGSLGLWKTVKQADIVLVWDWNSLAEAGEVARRSPKLQNVDRHHYGPDAWTWAALLETIRGEADYRSLLERSMCAFREYVDQLPDYDKAYVFGTGPSLGQAYEHDFSDGYRIVCNTIVNNPKLLDHIEPHFIVAGDALYHFANNPHARAFQRDVTSALSGRSLKFIMRDTFHPLFVHHHPEVAEHTFAAETGVPGIHLNVRERLVYHQWPHGNILNGLLLPLASGLADHIMFLGFDGRAPGEKYFWVNSPENTYDDLKPAMREAHPAFFSSTDFEAYAQSHSDNAETLMQAGEAQGKHYACLNASYVPAFQKRGSPAA